MSQKTNPISLRLQKGNKNFESCWYSDYFYNEMNAHDLRIRSYIEDVLNQIGDSQTLLCTQNNYKRFIIYLFLQDSRGIRSEREQSLRVPRMRAQPAVIEKDRGNEVEYLRKKYSVVLSKKMVVHKLEKQSLLESSSFSKMFFEDPQLRSKSYSNQVKTVNNSVALVECCNILFNVVKKHCFTLFSSSLRLRSEKGVNGVFKSTPLIPSKNTTAVLENNGTQRCSDSNLLEIALMGKSVASPFKPTSLNEVEDLFRRSSNILKKDIQMASFRNTSFLRVGDEHVKENLTDLSRRLDNPSLSNILQARRALTDVSRLKSFLYPTNFTSIYPIRVIQDIQNASFLINEIINLLQKRVGFKQIKDQILREILKNESLFGPTSLNRRGSTIRQPNESEKSPFRGLSKTGTLFSGHRKSLSTQIVKGIRISCSGRFGGRSKKAQKTKTQSIRWGESSSHLFSSKLSFASKSANTPFGKVGIKVWVCFK